MWSLYYAIDCSTMLVSLTVLSCDLTFVLLYYARLDCMQRSQIKPHPFEVRYSIRNGRSPAVNGRGQDGGTGSNGSMWLWKVS